MAQRRGGGLVGAAFTVGGFTMLSRVTGFARDMLIAAFLGAGVGADAFFVAFKLPNFFRRLFAEGAFNAAFVPLFSERLTRQGQTAAIGFASHVLAVLLGVLFLFVSAMQVAMPVAMYALAPGFSADPAKFALTVELTRITFPYLLFISLVSLMSGVLNGVGRFAAAAATPVLLNLSLIASLLLLVHLLPSAAHALAVGVFIAGVVQFAWLQVSLKRAGLSLRLPWPRLTPDVRRMLAVMLPAALGAGVVQVNLMIDVILASLLPEGAISFLFYADRIVQLPVGVVGVAVGTALLPLLSRQAAAGDDASARTSLNRAIELGLVLAVPAGVACVVIPDLLVAALFQRGAFGPAATAATAFTLAAYSAGLPAFVLVKVLGPAFFARQDTATPVRIAIISVAVNLVLNLVLMGPMAQAGLALATAISAWLTAGLMLLMLHRRGHFAADARLRQAVAKTVLGSAAMAAALLGAMAVLDPAAHTAEATRALMLALLVALALAVYGSVALASGLLRPAELKAMLRRRRAG